MVSGVLHKNLLVFGNKLLTMCAVERVGDEWAWREMFRRADSSPFHKRSGVGHVKERRLLALRPRDYVVREEIAVHYKKSIPYLLHLYQEGRCGFQGASFFTPDVGHEGKIGEVFFFAAWYDKAADQEVTLSCCLYSAQRCPSKHTMLLQERQRSDSYNEKRGFLWEKLL